MGQLQFPLEDLDGTPSPTGLTFIPEAIAEEDATVLIDTINSQPWMTSMSRRVQHYGWRYDYRARRVDRDAHLGPLPSFLSTIVELARRIASFDPDQAIVNEYLPGQGIAPHVDCEPCFGPVIMSIGLGSDVQMDFRHRETGDEWSMNFEEQGALILTDAARYDWTHSIRGRLTDPRFSINRRRRTSITLRRVITSW